MKTVEESKVTCLVFGLGFSMGLPISCENPLNVGDIMECQGKDYEVTKVEPTAPKGGEIQNVYVEVKQ